MQATSLEYINLDEQNVTNTGQDEVNQKIYKSLTTPWGQLYKLLSSVMRNIS
jgi:hypothetical protein